MASTAGFGQCLVCREPLYYTHASTLTLLGMMFDEFLSLTSGQHYRKRSGNLFSQGILQLEDCAALLIAFIRPDRPPIFDAQQSHHRPGLLTDDLEVAFKHVVHAKFTAGGKRVLLEPCVSAHS